MGCPFGLWSVLGLETGPSLSGWLLALPSSGWGCAFLLGVRETQVSRTIGTSVARRQNASDFALLKHN